MSILNLLNVRFVKSAVKAEDFTDDNLPRCVFVGRSNVGKSSTINALLGRKSVARVSSVPGKTVFVNLFLIDERLWFVDLPGYGYSKTSQKERERYSKLIESYFEAEMSKVSRLYLIVDARHKPTEGDLTMVNWIDHYNIPFTVIANKVDKLKNSQIEENLSIIRQKLNLGEEVPLIPFSAEKKTNRDKVLADIFAVYENAIKSPKDERIN